MKAWLLILTLIALAGLPGPGAAVQSGLHGQWSNVDSNLTEAESAEVEQGIESDQQGDGPDVISSANGIRFAPQASTVPGQLQTQLSGSFYSGYAIRAPPVFS